MPIVPSMHHRMSVASISSFDSLPEDEIVNGFLAPTLPKSRAASYERPSQLSINTASTNTSANVYFPSSSAEVSTAASVPSSPTKRSHSPEDSLSISSSSGHGHGNPHDTSVSPSSTISASSVPRPSAFLRRSATAPGNPTDLTLLMARRKRSAKELLETERSFLASLTLIDQEYYQPLMASLGRGKSGSMSPPQAGTPILSRKSIGEIFANFPDIMQLNRELLSRLEERFGQTFAKTPPTADPTEAEATWDPKSDSVGDILVTLAPFLKMYSLFVKNFSSALQRIEIEQKSNETFAKFLKATEQRRWDKEKSSTGSNGRQAFGFGLGFQAHLLTIVQRIPRYKLLVDDLIKCTPQTHSDRHDLMRAGQVIEQVASYINDNVRQHEMMLTILSLQKSLQGLQEPLVMPGRVLIKRGTLMKTCRRNIQPREFFLFTDCLIYASPISGGIESASAAWNALAQKGGLYGGGLTEQAPPSPVVDSPAGLSPIESVLEPISRLDPRSKTRTRTLSLQEPYTPLAGAIFSLAGHQLQFRAKYPLRDCTVVGVEDSLHVGLRHCFEIRTPDKSFAVYAETAASKEAWVTGIREARADFMSARRTLKADEDSIEAKRERRRSLYKLDAGKTNNRRLSTQSLGAYLAGANLGGQDTAISESEGENAVPAVARTPQRLSLRSRVDSMPTLLRPPSFPSFPSSATNLSLANLLASSSTTASAKPLRILEDYNAPVWVPDNRADKCANCSETFGIWRRKHHCRLCGQVVCWLCSQRSFLIPNYEEGDAYKPARACDPCYDSVFPADLPEESTSALADESLPTSAEMTSMPSTDGSDATALSAYRLDSDADIGPGSPKTPAGEGSPGISRAESPLTDSSPTTYASSMAHASHKAMEASRNMRPKSLRFEDASPPAMSEGDESPPLPIATQPSQEMPPLPARSKSLYSPSSRTPMPGMPHRASALEAHLFTNHSRPQIQAATSGSGTFRLMTPRLTTPESELPPGQSGGGARRSTYAPSIMTAGYFGVDSTCIPEGVEDPSTPTSTSMSFTNSPTPTSASPAKQSEVFRPSMMHAPNGVPPHLRSHMKRPMSAAARLSTFYGPMLTSERRK